MNRGANSDYWVKKIERNIERDKQKDRELKELGWKVIHFWSKDIEQNTEECYKKIIACCNERSSK